MLTPEQAQKELEKIKVEAWQTHRLVALEKLPTNLRSIARPLIGVNEDGGRYDYQERGQLKNEVVPLAAKMTREQRVELFEALFPGLGLAVERGWQLHNELPYSVGGWYVQTKSFRTPGKEALQLKARLSWVESLLNCIGQYPGKNLTWHAAWAGHIGWGAESTAILLAAAIESGSKEGNEVFEIICSIARGEHEHGVMGQYVLRTLLCASRPEGWELVEKLLLAAQREEGLRQAILEAVDAARPEPFRRMLRVILDNNLVRFSATVRALDVWLGYMWDSVSTGVANAVIEKLLLYLEDPAACAAALKGKDAEQAYLALWTIAFDNALAAIEPAGVLLKHPKVEFRFVAARLLAQMGLPPAQQKLHSVLEDEELHLPCCVLMAHQYGEFDQSLLDSDFFERLERLLKRFPEKAVTLKALVWPWTNYSLDRSLISKVMLKALGNRPATRLIPHLANFSSYERASALGLLAKNDQIEDASRDAFLAWIGDGSRSVRDAALAGLQKCKVTESAAPRLEELLTRSAGDLRRGVLGLLLKQSDERKNYNNDDLNWRDYGSPLGYWLQLTDWDRRFAAAVWSAEQHGRLYRLLRWSDEPFGRTNNLSDKGQPLSRDRASLEVLATAHAAGAATDADVLDQLLGTRDEGRYGSGSFDDLLQLTRRSGKELLDKYPKLKPLVERCRARILEIELSRGDTATPASKPAMSLKSVYGIDNLIGMLRALGKGNFKRGWSYDSEDKETVLSHLVRVCFPGAGETAADFARKVAATQISEERLVELALYAPQWGTQVEHALKWKSFMQGVWWIHAHTKGADWTVEEEIREAWKADLSRHTALTSEELLEGAVDVEWFNRVYADLGPKNWAVLDEAAKYASTGAGHARARLFADAMLNRVKKKELLTRMSKKRYQDAVRALGLLPLASGKSRESDLLERYKAMQEFIRTSKQFGSQRQASEKRAAQIGQENLARTAGYPDPIRLQWAMEARAVADLADGPISVKVEGVAVTLGIDPWGEIEFTVTKDGKALADIPPKLKKDKRIAALRERKTELKRQASRIRIALEQFMCRGESVTAVELQELMKHPLLSPMLSGLVLVGDGVLGYHTSGRLSLSVSSVK